MKKRNLFQERAVWQMEFDAVILLLALAGCSPQPNSLDRKVFKAYRQCERQSNYVIDFATLLPYDWDTLYYFSGKGPDAEFAAREKGTGEGIGWFAAKRGDVADGHARGIEAEMFFGREGVCDTPVR